MTLENFTVDVKQYIIMGIHIIACIYADVFKAEKILFSKITSK